MSYQNFLMVAFLVGTILSCDGDDASFSGGSGYEKEISVSSDAVVDTGSDFGSEARQDDVSGEKTEPRKFEDDFTFDVVINKNDQSLEKVDKTDPPTKEVIIDLCKKFQDDLLSRSFLLSFPPTSICLFGEEGNGNRVNGQFQARKKQTEFVTLPEGAVLCELAIESVVEGTEQVTTAQSYSSRYQTKQVVERNGFLYDDHFVFTIQNYILVRSHDALGVVDGDGHAVWDFDLVKGRLMGMDTMISCPVDAETCQFPSTDEPGDVKLKFKPEALAGVASKLKDVQKVEFSFIITGDNDDGDCEHSGLNLDVDARYYIP